MPAALGGQSNIRQVKVDLPKQLPSRLTTLQQTCTEQQFNANPAGCPAAPETRVSNERKGAAGMSISVCTVREHDDRHEAATSLKDY